jgi:7-cyano-7-deazaguanine synthase
MEIGTIEPKGIVLLSGGMDSCVTAAIAARECGRVAALHVSYGQLTEAREHRSYEEIADYYGIEERMAVNQSYLGRIGGSALTDASIPLRETELGNRDQGTGNRSTSGASFEATDIPASYVPFRNAHFLAAAVSWAEVIGAGRIYIGAVEQDSSGYPDCRPEYYRIFNRLIEAGTRPETRVEIVTPLIHLRKHEIVKKGVELGAPFHLSWSCYRSSDSACGVCDSCALRLRAFAEAGAEDPIPYSSRAGMPSRPKI